MIETGNISALLVDDDTILRESIAAYLEDYGYQVQEAGNGRIALEMFRQQRPDIILLDLRMPEMDGMELLPILVEEAPEMPVLIVSGMGTMDDSIYALRLGAWDFITKPIHDFEFLDHAMNKAFERARLIRENREYRQHLEDEVAKRTADLARVNQALRTLSRCNESLIHAENEQDFLEELCRVITEVGGYTGAWVGFIKQQKEGKVIQHMASKGIDSSLMEDCITIPEDIDQGEMMALHTAALGETTVIQDVLSHPGCARFCDKLCQLNIRSVAAFPLREEKELFGVLAIYSNEANIYGEEEVQLLSELSGDLGFGISMLRMRAEREQAVKEQETSARQLHSSMIQAIQAIAMTVEKRDPYTSGHQQRVATLAVAIATELGWDKQRLQGLELGTLIHDIGKIYVPAEILNRPGKLTKSEFDIIKTHPDVGYDIIKDVEFPWPVADMVHQHHERLDGSGYPQGLKGDEIILEAKVLTVADVVEAITSHRPYRPGFDLDVALNEIKNNRGKFYAPDVVDACVKIITEKNFVLEGWTSEK